MVSHEIWSAYLSSSSDQKSGDLVPHQKESTVHTPYIVHGSLEKSSQDRMLAIAYGVRIIIIHWLQVLFAE